MAFSLCRVLKVAFYFFKNFLEVAAIEKLIAIEVLQLLGKTEICFLRQKSNL